MTGTGRVEQQALWDLESAADSYQKIRRAHQELADRRLAAAAARGDYAKAVAAVKAAQAKLEALLDEQTRPMPLLDGAAAWNQAGATPAAGVHQNGQEVNQKVQEVNQSLQPPPSTKRPSVPRRWQCRDCGAVKVQKSEPYHCPGCNKTGAPWQCVCDCGADRTGPSAEAHLPSCPAAKVAAAPGNLFLDPPESAKVDNRNAANWRGHVVTNLDEPDDVIAALRAAGMLVIGQLADWLDAGNATIPGLLLTQVEGLRDKVNLARADDPDYEPEKEEEEDDADDGQGDDAIPRPDGEPWPEGLSRKAVEAACIVNRFASKTPMKPESVKAFTLDGRLWVNTGGLHHGPYSAFKCDPLIPLDDFKERFPGIEPKFGPRLPRDATDEDRRQFYLGIQVRYGKQIYCVGSAGEQRTLVYEEDSK